MLRPYTTLPFTGPGRAAGLPAESARQPEHVVERVRSGPKCHHRQRGDDEHQVVFVAAVLHEEALRCVDLGDRDRHRGQHHREGRGQSPWRNRNPSVRYRNASVRVPVVEVAPAEFVIKPTSATSLFAPQPRDSETPKCHSVWWAAVSETCWVPTPASARKPHPRRCHEYTARPSDRKSTRLNSSHLVISYAV